MKDGEKMDRQNISKVELEDRALQRCIGQEWPTHIQLGTKGEEKYEDITISEY